MKQLSTPGRRSGFSLVELSIVLVILGLLIGGIFAGQNLIEAAKMRSVMTDANTYLSAVNQFRTQYRYLPGDLPNAATYWSSGYGNTSGDGDGIINSTGSATDEEFMAWGQMNLAGYIDKSFSSAASPTAGTNIPEARIPTAGFRIYYANFDGDTTTYTVNMGNMLSFGANGSTAILKPADAYMIDVKMDDGLPGTGKWLSKDNNAAFNATPAATACTTSSSKTDYTGLYKTANDTVACSLMIQTGY